MSLINSITYNAHFELLSKLLLEHSKKQPTKSQPYLKAIKEMYFIYNSLEIENRELKLLNKQENNALLKRMKKLTSQNVKLQDKINEYEQIFKNK